MEIFSYPLRFNKLYSTKGKKTDDNIEDIEYDSDSQDATSDITEDQLSMFTD